MQDPSCKSDCREWCLYWDNDSKSCSYYVGEKMTLLDGDDDDYKVVNWGDKKIDLTGLNVFCEMRPVEFHVKMDGSFHGPSIAMVSCDSVGRCIVSQISLKMLKDVIRDIEVMIQ
jgi:hypothetical protein